MGHQQGNINPDDFLIVIPSRLQSERLPEKPLLKIAGISLIGRVIKQLKPLQVTMLVATDSERIAQEAENFNAKAVITSPSHQNGTSRCIEAFEKYCLESGKKPSYLINVQGDEPLIHPNQLLELITLLNANRHIAIATLAKQIEDYDTFINPNIVKVVCKNVNNNTSNALYFSRSAIPHHRGNKVGFKPDYGLKHVGIYAFAAGIIPTIKEMKPTALENVEKLEQLRWLQNGLEIAVQQTAYDNIGVDTAEDLLSVENFLKNNS